jgi:hypothetical protein
MSQRPKDVMLNGKGYGVGKGAPMLDLKNGGQMGYMPDHQAIISSAAYVRRNIICFLVQHPRGFEDLDQSDTLIATLKALVELHPKTIDGLQSTLEVEWTENAFGGAGEMQQDVSNVTRARSTPSFTWVEKYGMPINAFLEYWITNLLMDPNSKYPGVVTRGSKKVQDLLPDYVGATMLFVEPDPTHSKVMRAWLCTNMMPKSGGEVTGKRDITSAGETLEYSVEFSAITQVGTGVNKFAQQMLDQLTLTGTNPNQRQAMIDQIDAEVKAGAQGYTNQLADASRSTVRP